MASDGRLPLVLLIAAFVSGCTAEPAAPTPLPSEPAAPAPELHQVWLKPQHRLDSAPPASSAPVKEYAGPTSPGYLNEDIERFDGIPGMGGNVTKAVLDLHYAFDRPTVDPFRTGPGVDPTRHFVIWLGSNGTYPSYATVTGPAVVQPGAPYHARLEFPLPPGGWTLPPQERVELLVVPLVLNDGPPNLHYLVDHESTPSRLELNVTRASSLAADYTCVELRSITLPANSGLFTGATQGERSTAREPVAFGNATFALLEVRWKSTVGGKSDLDFYVEGPAGAVVFSSTTPFQNETIRLFAPNLGALAKGAEYALVVDAYSGANTQFDLVVSTMGTTNTILGSSPAACLSGKG